jgi:hypothetical protein
MQSDGAQFSNINHLAIEYPLLGRNPEAFLNDTDSNTSSLEISVSVDAGAASSFFLWLSSAFMFQSVLRLLPLC